MHGKSKLEKFVREVKDKYFYVLPTPGGKAVEVSVQMLVFKYNNKNSVLVNNEGFSAI